MLFVAICLLLSYVLILFFGAKYPDAFWFFFLAVTTRVIMLYVNFYGVYYVPGANADASRFLNRAESYSSYSWSSLFDGLSLSGGATNYSIFGASLLKMFGSHPLVVPSFNILLGTGVLLLLHKIVRDMWGGRPANISVLIFALYPFAIFNSVIALREEVSIFFFLLGLLFFLNWIRTASSLALLLSFIPMVIAISFHPGWSGGIAGMALFLLYSSRKTLLDSFSNGSIDRKEALRLMVMLTTVVGVLVFLIFSGFSLFTPFEAYMDEGADLEETLQSRFINDPIGGSAFPGAIATGDPASQPWLIPARMVYFKFSPFPWDIRSVRHLLGMVSSALYFFLAWRVYKGWHLIKYRNECIAILLMLVALTFVFSMGVTNIGTAIRHKTKFLVLFLILAASSFDVLRISFKRI